MPSAAPLAPPLPDTPDAQLDRLLAETVEAAALRESSRYREIEGDLRRPVVLLGAGNLGRRTLRGLLSLGYEVVAFTDNASTRWGTEMDGVPVLSPDEAARRYGQEAVFVVSIWRAEGGFRTAELVDTLRSRGCTRVARIGELYWAHPETFLPYYGYDLPSRALTQKDAIRRAFALLTDEASRREFVAQLRWRLYNDADGLALDLSLPIYFPPDLLRLRDDEVLVDAGGFDGDTVRSFLEANQGRCRCVFTFEPDPTNSERLMAYAAATGDPRIQVLPYALGDADTTASFAADGTAAARLTASGHLSVEVRRLCGIAGAEAMTFYKLDIEGAEPEAIAGAEPILRRNRPVVAVSVYHLQGHLWQIPCQLAGMLPADYCWHLRAYTPEGFDAVLYAVPLERAVAR